MIKKCVLITLPKLSSYANKEFEEQQKLKTMVTKWVEFFNDNDFVVQFIAEDMLASKLLGEVESIEWISALGSSDRHFMSTSVEEIPEEYSIVLKKSRQSQYIRDSLNKYKVKDAEAFNGDEIAQKGDRFNVLNNRVMFVANKEVENAKAIVYFQNNNNYCKVPSTNLGDGKLAVIVDVRNMIEYFTYGGIQLNLTDLNTIVGGL